MLYMKNHKIKMNQKLIKGGWKKSAAFIKTAWSTCLISLYNVIRLYGNISENIKDLRLGALPCKEINLTAGEL